MKVAIRRIGLRSLAEHGCLLGAIAALVPSLLCGLLTLGAAGLVRGWLESWQDLRINLLGREIARFDLVQWLRLDQALEVLKTVTRTPWLEVVSVVAVLALVSGALLAIVVVLVGLGYNLLASATGGVVVEARSLDPTPREGPPQR